MIDRTPVTSSNVASVGYDPDTKVMSIEFKDGSVYHYHDVESDLHEQLLAAKSIGSFLHKNVKGAYKFTKQ